MSLLNSLGLLLAKSTSFARYFLALSFALTAISIAACSWNNTTTTDTTAADKKKCEDAGDTWDDTKAAGKKCVKSDTTANGNGTGTEEDGGETTTGTKDVTFEFAFADTDDALNTGFAETKVDLNAKLDVDGDGDGEAVNFTAGDFSVKKTGTKKLTFTLKAAALTKATEALKDVNTDKATNDAKNAVVLTLTKDESVTLQAQTLFTFLKGLSDEGTTFDNLAGTDDATEAELSTLLEKFNALFTATANEQ